MIIAPTLTIGHFEGNTRLFGEKFLQRFNDMELVLLSPEGNCESEGPPDSLSILYVIGEPKLGLQKNPTIFAFLKVSKTFIPRREVRKYTRWCPNDFLMVYCTSELKLEFQFCNGKSPKKFGGTHLLCGWEP